MKLTLSSRSPWKSEFYDSQTGDLVYKTTIDIKLFGPTTITLDRVIPSEQYGELQFTRISTIEFHTVSSNVISIGGQKVPTKDLLHTKGVWKTLVSRDRYIIGPDGTEYKWVFGYTKPELYVSDASNALVAKYHRPHTGLLSKSGPTPASLEIFPHHPEGYDQATIDLIVTTFIYLEKKREDEEKGRNAAASANAASTAAAA